jgi:outer membrane protein
MSVEARATKEQQLASQQEALQQAAMSAQNELTELQTNLVYQLSEKLRVVVGKIAVEKGYDLVLDASTVPFVGSSVINITDLLVQRYDAENP